MEQDAKINLGEVEVVTTYFAKAKKAQDEGYTPISIAQYQPKGVNFLVLQCLAPSDFCRRLHKRGRLEEFRREYYRITDTETTMQTISSFLRKNSLTKIALVCWERDDDVCHRRFARDILNRRIAFASKIEEYMTHKE